MMNMIIVKNGLKAIKERQECSCEYNKKYGGICLKHDLIFSTELIKENDN